MGIEILSDRIVGEGGFLAIRRLEVVNVHADGSRSRRYLVDYMVRPKGLDAVVVAVFRIDARGEVEVLVRDGLRPPLHVGRPADRQPIADPRRYLFFTELVAGIIEPEDVDEEAGLRVDPAKVFFLGTGVFPSPGALSEKFHLCAVEVEDGAEAGAILGDGSPYEEGATTRWMGLRDAIDRCTRGEIEDAKTEIALRRLADRLRHSAAR
jgi:ADP-ribose pyrophosphatase